jgi:hypothetical protein
LETAAKLLKSLEGILSPFSKCALKSLNNQTDFDSAIRRFDPSRRQPIDIARLIAFGVVSFCVARFRCPLKRDVAISLATYSLPVQVAQSSVHRWEKRVSNLRRS